MQGWAWIEVYPCFIKYNYNKYYVYKMVLQIYVTMSLLYCQMIG